MARCERAAGIGSADGMQMQPMRSADVPPTTANYYEPTYLL